MLFAFLFAFPSASYADTFTGNTASSTDGLGNFMGEFTYKYFSSTNAVFDVTLTNTSAISNGGYLTGFVFNNPNNYISGVTLASSNSSFELLGAQSFNDSVSASPYGKFDIGAALGGNFLGGGSPLSGIAVNNTATFEFALSGNNLDQLSVSSFVGATASSNEFFVARFRGFENGGSDKVPGFYSVPEPSTWLLICLGFVGLMVFRNRQQDVQESELLYKWQRLSEV